MSDLIARLGAASEGHEPRIAHIYKLLREAAAALRDRLDAAEKGLPPVPERFACEDSYGGCVMSPEPIGYWIAFKDYDTLRAHAIALEAERDELRGEVERLRAQLDVEADEASTKIDELRNLLSGQVERAEAADSALALEKSKREAAEEGKDDAYLQRNYLVAALARLFTSGIRATNIEGWSPDWHGCVYIDLPSGQISYHYHDSQAHLFANLPPYTKEWDGHDKDTVHARLSTIAAQEPK